MRVDYQDRDEQINYATLGLRSVGLNVEYDTVELIVETLKKVEELKGDFSIMDASRIQAKHEEKWKKYFENKEKEQ
jgi:hypothetical protein